MGAAGLMGDVGAIVENAGKASFAVSCFTLGDSTGALGAAAAKACPRFGGSIGRPVGAAGLDALPWSDV